MGILNGFWKKKAAEPVNNVDSFVRGDALRVMEILRGSMYSCSMSWEELLVRFCRMQGLSRDVGQERLIHALELLKRSQGFSWAGIGTEIHFSRTIPIVVI